MQAGHTARSGVRLLCCPVPSASELANRAPQCCTAMQEASRHEYRCCADTPSRWQGREHALTAVHAHAQMHVQATIFRVPYT